MWRLVTPGILVLAKLAEETGIYDVQLVDEEFQQLDLTKKYDLVAMYTVTPNTRRAYELAEHYKKQGAYVVLGGVHTTVCPDEAGKHADTILIGEAEYIWPAFLEDFQNDAVKKTYAQPLGEVDINRSPIPSFHLLPENARKLIPIQTARGCPHGCKFCNLRSLYGKQYRAKRIESIVKEIEAAKHINPRAVIYFTDDNLFCNRTHAEALMQKVSEYNIIWYANTDISFGSDIEFIKAAYKSGCRQVLIGLESVNQANLKGLDENSFKSQNFLLYKELIENIQSCGIGVIGSFILGLDEDDEEVFDNTIYFILDTKLYGASVTVNTPYPGTVSFDMMSAENRILTYDWNHYTIFNPVIIPKKMTVEQLNEGYLRVLRTINSPDNIKEKVNYFKELMRNREK
jgi:radical SAM superfamily enzyme YgiQ (UPF0313 family)